MCRHELWPTSGSHPFSLNSSLVGFARGKHYQKITIPIFRLILQNFAIPGPRFNIKMSSYQYRKSLGGDKTVVRSSYLHNGISYTGKMSSLYWIGAQVLFHHSISPYFLWLVCYCSLDSDCAGVMMAGLRYLVMCMFELHGQLEESTARRQLKSPRSLSGRSMHLTLLIKWSWSWSWMTYCHPLCAMSIGPPILRYSYFKIWPWKSMVKVKCVVKGQGHVWPSKYKGQAHGQGQTWWSHLRPWSSINMFAFSFCGNRTIFG